MQSRKAYLVQAILFASLFGVACQRSEPPAVAEDPQPEVEARPNAWIDDARIAGADAEPHNWLAHGRTWSEQRYSPLDQINESTVAGLGLAWFADLDTRRGQEATPIVVDGVLYSTSAWSKVQAVDAKTGRLLWQYDPEVPGIWDVRACCGVQNRGPAVWKGQVYSATLDGRLLSLDAETGELNWEVNTTDQAQSYTITGAPRVFGDKLIIGNGGAEYGVRGYVAAYDTESGEMPITDIAGIQNQGVRIFPGDVRNGVKLRVHLTNSYEHHEATHDQEKFV